MSGSNSRAPLFRGRRDISTPPLAYRTQQLMSCFSTLSFQFLVSSFSLFHFSSSFPHCSGYDAGASSSRWERLAMRLCFEIPTRYFCCCHFMFVLSF